MKIHKTKYEIVIIFNNFYFKEVLTALFINFFLVMVWIELVILGVGLCIFFFFFSVIHVRGFDLGGLFTQSNSSELQPY